jgi:hypothetical protein
MKKIVFIAACSFAAFGCAKKGGDCGKAISNSMEVSKADMKKMPGVDDKAMAKMRDLGLQHCKDDKWSADATKCMSDAKTETDAQGCYSKLTPDQQEQMNKAMREMMTPPSGAGVRAAPMGSDTGAASPPAAGSDTPGGSAGSAAAPQ